MAVATFTVSSLFYWPYYTLRDGRLYDEHGELGFPNAPKFGDVAEADAWLEANDERGNVREATR